MKGVGAAGRVAAPVLGATARIAARAAGVFAGIGMAGWDAVSAFFHPEEFVKSRFISAVAAFFGGKETGIKGMTSGAIKGSLIGMIGGPMGAAIGGIIGGILGFVGGKDLAQKFVAQLKDLKKIGSVIWRVATFPLRVVSEVTKSIFVIGKFYVKKLYEKIDAWLSGPGFIGDLWNRFKELVGSLYNKFVFGLNLIKEKIDALLGADFWKRLGEQMKKGLLAIMFPISTIVRMWKSIGGFIDKKISALPIIGSIYQKAKLLMKEISGGTLAETIEKTLEAEPKGAIPRPIEIPPKVMRRLEAIPLAPPTTGKEIARARAKEKATEEKRADKRMKEQTDKYLAKLDETSKAQSNTMINTSSAIINSQSANSSTSISGGSMADRWRSAFSSGSEATKEVLKANLT